MPRGRPKRWEFEREPMVRVVVYLERQVLEDLELLVRWRGLGKTRSEIVRAAIRSALAHHATHVIRLRNRAQRQRREREELERALTMTPEDRDWANRQAVIAEAVSISSEGD
jgi:Arc/MetJ-type ribon-helix-helix transcriptional regulator